MKLWSSAMDDILFKGIDIEIEKKNIEIYFTTDLQT